MGSKVGKKHQEAPKCTKSLKVFGWQVGEKHQKSTKDRAKGSVKWSEDMWKKWDDMWIKQIIAPNLTEQFDRTMINISKVKVVKYIL